MNNIFKNSNIIIYISDAFYHYISSTSIRKALKGVLEDTQMRDKISKSSVS